MKRFFGLRHYIAFLRRQPRHMQHVYAAIFAGTITVLLGVIILYYDYGFWRTRYDRNEKILEKDTTDPMVTVLSPSKMIGGFFKEAGTRFKTIKKDSSNFIQGKEEYKQDHHATTSSSSSMQSIETKYER